MTAHPGAADPAAPGCLLCGPALGRAVIHTAHRQQNDTPHRMARGEVGLVWIYASCFRCTRRHMSAHSQSPTAKQKLSAPSVYAEENREIEPSCAAPMSTIISHTTHRPVLIPAASQNSRLRANRQRAPTPAAISSRYRTIRPIMPAETNVHSISRSVNGFIKPTSYPTQ